MDYPDVNINGHGLSDGEIMTIRVALQAYAMDLNESILGEDAQGQIMMEGYKANIRSIFRKMQGAEQLEVGSRVVVNYEDRVFKGRVCKTTHSANGTTSACVDAPNWDINKKIPIEFIKLQRQDAGPCDAGPCDAGPCDTCGDDGFVHDADFSDGDSDQKMFLMQDTMRDCPDCTETILGVKIGEDGKCECHCGNVCPLGRTGMENRCTREELLNAQRDGE